MKKALILDDDTSILDMIEEALTYENFSVETVSECERIHHQIIEYKPDVVLLDYLVGRENGGEICHQIKTNPLTSHIPVIIISAYPKVFLSLGNYGCDFFLPKPFSLDQLYKAVDKCIYKTEKSLCI